MKFKLWKLSGARNTENWFLKRMDMPDRAHLIDPADPGQTKLLAFLGMAKFGLGTLPELIEGEFEL